MFFLLTPPLFRIKLRFRRDRKEPPTELFELWGDRKENIRCRTLKSLDLETEKQFYKLYCFWPPLAPIVGMVIPLM